MGLFRRGEAVEAVVPQAAPAERPEVREKGSFVFGACAECEWTGPGRRSRSAAEADAREHGQKGCDAAGTPAD